MEAQAKDKSASPVPAILVAGLSSLNAQGQSVTHGGLTRLGSGCTSSG